MSYMVLPEFYLENRTVETLFLFFYMLLESLFGIPLSKIRVVFLLAIYFIAFVSNRARGNIIS